MFRPAGSLLQAVYCTRMSPFTNIYTFVEIEIILYIKFFFNNTSVKNLSATR